MRVTLDDRLTLEAGYQYVYLYGAAFTGHRLEPQEVVALPASVQWFRKRLTFEEKMPADVPSDLRAIGLDEAWFDLDTVHLPLTIRHSRPGDRMLTFGGHQRKLQDLYTDAKVDRVLRPRYPLVCDADGIIWLPGLARSAAGAVTRVSRHFLRIVYYSSQC